MVAFQVAIYGGLALASPFIMYFIAHFIFPALKWKEKKYINQALYISVAVVHSGRVVLLFRAAAVRAGGLAGLFELLDSPRNIWQAEEYISSCCKFMLGMGWIPVPVISWCWSRSGFELPHPFQGAKYMIVINLCWRAADDARGADPGADGPALAGTI